LRNSGCLFRDGYLGMRTGLGAASVDFEWRQGPLAMRRVRLQGSIIDHPGRSCGLSYHTPPNLTKPGISISQRLNNSFLRATLARPTRPFSLSSRASGPGAIIYSIPHRVRGMEADVIESIASGSRACLVFPPQFPVRVNELVMMVRGVRRLY
jgi:hypothetical protein